MVLSVYCKAHRNNVLDPSLQLIVLLHGGDSFRGPGQDEIPFLQGDEVADVADEIWDGEDHLRGAAALSKLIIYFQPQADLPRVRDALFGDELADRTRGVESLGHGPGQTFGLALVLDVSGCHVQAESITRNMLHSGGLRDGRAPFPDHHPQLHFMVQISGVKGHQDRRALSHICSRRLQEQDRLLRNRVFQLFGVIRIVSPNANDLPPPFPEPGNIPCCHRGEQ